MRRIPIPGSEGTLPVLGQGSWGLGEDPARRKAEVDALLEGFALGLTLVDTAEIYAGGRAEEVVGEALRGQREAVFVVVKVWPSHARHPDFIRSVRGSLRRLGTDRADAVLLHWPTRSIPWGETEAAMEELLRLGLCRFVGCSNFDLPSWQAVEATGGPDLRFHELPFSLGDRRVEHDLLPYHRGRGQVVLAYSPLQRGRLRRHPGFPVLAAEAAAYGITPEAMALAWLVADGGVVALPKASDKEHVRQNARAGEVEIAPETRRRLEAAFPLSPRRFRPFLPPYLPLHRLIFRWLAR